MGNGRRNGNRVNFQATADYDMQPADYGRWERSFNKASEILHNATNGQLRFGDIFVTKNSEGISNADFVLKDPSLATRSTSSGRFGTAGGRITLAGVVQTARVLTTIHELGHGIWGLSEEYARTFRLTIDTVTALPIGHGNLIVPIQVTALGVSDAILETGSVILFWAGGINETREIATKTATQITVTSAFSMNPQTASGVAIQLVAECTGDPSTGACIMEFSGGAAGTLSTSGVWTPAMNPVTEFCTPANHDPDSDTDQQNIHGRSCWEHIVAQTGYADFVAPAAGTASSGLQPAGFVPPNWRVLESAPRFALVLDRSGSMNTGGGSRLQGLKTGATYWIDTCAVAADKLTIVWYDSIANIFLGLTDFGTLNATQIANLRDEISEQTASGATNIRDGLMVAFSQLTSVAPAASVQAALLLTDGAHNTPAGSSMQDIVPAYQAANTNVYTLGIGTGGEMDLPGLNTLATSTGGIALTSGDGGIALDIQNRMIEINNLIRGGLIASIGEVMPENLKEDINFEKETPFGKRLALKKIAAKLGQNSIKELLKNEKFNRTLVKSFILEVEKGVTAATFTLSFDKAGALWMYLIDPNGKEVTSTYPDLIDFVGSPAQPYEFAKIKSPQAGRWTVVAFKPKPVSGRISMKAFAGIENSKISTYGHAIQDAKLQSLILIRAGAAYGDYLTGINVSVYVKGTDGKVYQKTLHDDNDNGIYETYYLLQNGYYQGYVEIRSKGNTLIADPLQAIMKSDDPNKVGNLIVKHPPFIRTIPISFYVGKPKKVRNKYEQDFIKK